jgi:hypothetical protein
MLIFLRPLFWTLAVLGLLLAPVVITEALFGNVHSYEGWHP